MTKTIQLNIDGTLNEITPIMKLRYLEVYDKFESWNLPILQYWDEDDKKWIDINHIVCKQQDVDEFNKNEKLC